MRIPTTDYPAYRRMVKDALQDGQLVRLRGGRLSVNAGHTAVKGRLYVSRAGHGFVIPDDNSAEVFISPRDMGGALHGEEVRVVVKDTRAGKNREGKIIGVIGREKGRIVGQLHRSRFGFYAVPDDPRMQAHIDVENPGKLPLKPDLVVTVRLYPWEAPFLPPRGFVEEVLGEAGAPGVDMESLIVSHGLPGEFDDKVKSELAKIRKNIPRRETADRLDLRNQVSFTIDPADAKDHDDAISLERVRDGHYELGVHIADVSYYVRENSALDREALLRGNSIYLVDRVIPMLPEKLSGDICSLHEGADRLTLSFIAEIDNSGRVFNWEFKESVIHSKASLTYEEVQDYLDGRSRAKIKRESGAILKKMLEVSQALRKSRLEKGSLDFDLPEPRVVLDSEGRVLDIFARARMPSHQIVEEFMLMANRHAAAFLEGKGVPILFRVHARPDKEKIRNFGELLTEMGYSFSFKGEITPKKLQRVLEAVKDKPEEPFVEEILLRSLAKAVYQPENIGHFGLAFPTYTHFTSPIRRYPDLLVHRALKMVLHQKLTSAVASELRSTLKSIGTHCTATEIAADEAERDSVKIKQLEFLVERVGGVYEGIVSGVVKSGFFVELIGSMVEGFVPFSSVKEDYFVLDEGKHRAHGRRSGRVFKLGDRVRVIVAKVDMENKRADFVLVNAAEKEVKERARGRRKKK